MRHIKTVEIFTDGACSGNPGPGGYGVVLRFGNIEKELSGGDSATTNNRMELLAIISVLFSLPKGSSVKIYTDSQYCIKAVKSSNSKKNLDLLRKYHEITLGLCSVNFEWVRGHNGNVWNEECDRMANGEYQKLK